MMSGDRDPFDDIVFRRTAGSSTSFNNVQHTSKDTSTNSFTRNTSNTFSPTNSNVTRSLLNRPPPRRRIPKLNVKLYVHEEVSSTQDKKNAMDEVSAHVLLDGSIKAQVSSSDRHNTIPPFSMRITDPDYPDDTNFQFDSNLFTVYGPSEYNTLSIPQTTADYVKIASYHRSATKKFMPVLVQSKINRFGNDMKQCKVAVQIRSNLNNVGSLVDINLVMAFPPTVIGKTVKIAPGPGSGAYDELKRVIRWNVKDLQQGNSIVFAVEVMIGSSILVDELPKFPILLRCKSIEDTVSSVQINCKQLDDDHPVILNVTRESSFQLLHRLPS
jgi:hypothetical protein